MTAKGLLNVCVCVLFHLQQRADRVLVQSVLHQVPGAVQCRRGAASHQHRPH